MYGNNLHEMFNVSVVHKSHEKKSVLADGFALLVSPLVLGIFIAGRAQMTS